MNKKAFSLVELMIVVAIIGVLTAIAIPNFQSFQRRSRQSEAKSALTALYTAEQTFHSSWEVYTGSLKPAGWTPSGEYRYQIGFNTDDADSGKFCGGSGGGNVIMDGDTIGCGPAPGRTYTGVDDGVDEVNVEEFCANNMNDCTILFKAMGLVSKAITQGTVAMSSMMSVTQPASDSGQVAAAVGVNNFTAGAVANLLGLEDTAMNQMKFDVWIIDQEKNLAHRHNGAEF